MKCIKCRTKNITKAKYCKKCAYEFSKEEQKAARKKTLIGKIEWLEKAYEVCTLKVITDHIIFKVISILIIMGVGMYIWINHGIDLRLLNSKDYSIQYNINEEEYYLMTDNDKVLLNLYIPNRTEEITIVHYDEEDNIIEEKKYKPKEEIILETKEKEYYVLNVEYLYDNEDSFKFYVLKEK